MTTEAEKSFSMKVADHAVNEVSFIDDGPGPGQQRHAEENAALENLGYRAEFKREFNTLSVAAVSVSMIAIFVGINGSLFSSLGYSGNAGLVYAWPAACFFIFLNVLSMAELASSMPTAGGLYYAAFKLAPEGWGPFASWCTGWANLLGQATTAPTGNWFAASFIVAVVGIFHPDYTQASWKTYLVYVGIMTTQATVAMTPTRLISYINTFGATLQTLLCVAAMIALPAATKLRPRFNSNPEVWASLVNGTGWPDGFAFLMSFLSAIFVLVGYDAPFHLSEETANARQSVPRAIVYSAGFSMVLGWLLSIVLAYVIRDASSTLGAASGQPTAAYLLALLPKSGAYFFIVVTIICIWFNGLACMTSSSRVVFAYSRDGAIPLSGVFRVLNSRTQTPVRAVWLVCLWGCLLGLLSFASPVAINAVFSIAAISQFTAFSMPVGIKLFFGGHGRFIPGPWSLGRWSRPVNAVAFAFACFIVPVLCFPVLPSSKGLNAQNFNYTCLIFGGAMSMSIAWYMISAHKHFRGPVDNTLEGHHGIVDQPRD